MAIHTTECIDLVLFHVLKEVENGTYIDVGANDPWDCSVTKLFYDRGWSGINIEPQKICYDLLQADRPRDINICVGAGNCETELELYGKGWMATLDRSLAKKEAVSNPTVIKIMTLTKILDDMRPDGDIHFCKIDAEGYSRQVLEGLDLKRYRPWVFVVESAVPGTRKPSFEDWEHILINNGYEVAMVDTYNRYYVDRGHIPLKDRFLEAGRLCEIYDAYIVGPFCPHGVWVDIIKGFFGKLLEKIKGN